MILVADIHSPTQLVYLSLHQHHGERRVLHGPSYVDRSKSINHRYQISLIWIARPSSTCSEAAHVEQQKTRKQRQKRQMHIQFGSSCREIPILFSWDQPLSASQLKQKLNMKRTPGLTKEKDSGFGHYTVPTATPRPNYTKYPLRSPGFGRLFISGSHGKCQSSGQGLRIGQGRPEIFGDIGAKERTAKAEEATAKR